MRWMLSKSFLANAEASRVCQRMQQRRSRERNKEELGMLENTAEANLAERIKPQGSPYT